MITYQRIGSYVTADPFRPFRIQLTDGRACEIRHPDTVQIGRTTISISTFMSDDPDEVKKGKIEFPLHLVELVEPLDGVASTSGRVMKKCADQRRSVMVPPQDILNYLRAVPFRPFRIHMASGRTFDIPHPEMVRVGRGTLIVFTFVSDEPEIFNRWDTVSLMLIENVSHYETPAA